MTSLFTPVNTQLADKVKATTCESESHINNNNYTLLEKVCEFSHQF